MLKNMMLDRCFSMFVSVSQPSNGHHQTINQINGQYYRQIVLLLILFFTYVTDALRPYNYYAPHQFPETGPLSYKLVFLFNSLICLKKLIFLILFF